MKYFILLLLAVALLWIASIAWANRRKSPHANRDSGGSDSGGGDSCGGFFSPDCGSSDGGCGGGGD